MRIVQRCHKLFCQAMDNKIEAKSFVRRDKLISLESRARSIWERNSYFAVQPNEQPKFFMTFPYAYMNGKLHIGHAYSVTKCDFNAWYKRISGFNVLFPFGFHCTGMPISAAAKRLGRQLQQYGNPPVFPQGYKSQYHILKQMGIKSEEIQKFIDPVYWVKYFPPIGSDNIAKFGVHVDKSRSFVTTDINPYYNSFIQWQFNLLKERGYIKFGKRPSIYSTIDNQMCADHDRREGQGVAPEQYTLIKIKIIELNERLKKSLADRKVYLVAATLRPETMYGQTCCFLLPSGDYCAVEMQNNQVFICSERSARNMAYQGLTKQAEKVQIIDKFKGQQLMGLPISAPLSIYEKIYILPMMTISMKKGTGVVTCVPSDSPDDWMAISDLRNKKAFREKYGITEEMVNLEPVEIINIPTYGNLSALTLCEQKKIKSQNDRALLDEAKQQCYKKGFHEGTMVIGEFKGEKVIDAKSLVKKQLIQKTVGVVYYEPNGHVVSRSGDECVVSYCDQWFINYADPVWKKKVLTHLEQTFKCNSQTLHDDLVYTVNWLHEWGCSRSFGLGTRLPFDSQYLIESLSDSTIYMAYYTIAHFLQGNLDGSQVGLLGIKNTDITPDFWDFVFLGKQYTSNKISQYKLQILRKSFQYWYPLDLRCSAKDLIKNHLTMSLFNHVAIWQDQPDKWPRGYFCNGYIQVEGQKMSKSKGNFFTIEQILQEYGADASRLACAQAGDSINDANFTQQVANAAIIQISTLEMYFGKVLQENKNYRKKDQKTEADQFDIIFQSEIEDQISKVKGAYDQMIYRDVVKYGLHEFVSIKDAYILNCGKFKPRIDLVQRYIYLQLLFIYPICPHFCEVSYIDYFLSLIENSKQYPKLLGSCRFPTTSVEINYTAIRSHKYMAKFLSNARESFKKVSKPKKGQVPKFEKGTIIYREKFQDYQFEILKILRGCVNQEGQIRADWRNQVTIENKQQKTKALRFGAYIADEFKVFGKQALDDTLIFDEKRTLQKFWNVIKSEINLELEIIQVENAPKRQGKNWIETLNSVTPGNPAIVFD